MAKRPPPEAKLQLSSLSPAPSPSIAPSPGTFWYGAVAPPDPAPLPAKPCRPHAGLPKALGTLPGLRTGTRFQNVMVRLYSKAATASRAVREGACQDLDDGEDTL